jgi:hypothetical protein
MSLKTEKIPGVITVHFQVNRIHFRMRTISIPAASQRTGTVMFPVANTV